MDRELNERIANMDDDELLRMVEVDHADYRQDAIDFAKSELMSRGVSFCDPSGSGGSSGSSPDVGMDIDLSNYSYEAIQRAREVLAQRDMELARAAQVARARESDEEDDEEEIEDEERDTSHAEGREIACPICGGETRYGMLMSEQTLTMVFTDTSERRYVDAYACEKCGRIQLVLDLEQSAE